MKNISATVIRCGLLAALFALQGAQAQQTKAPRPVTRDELRACMNNESDMAAKREDIKARNTKNGEEKAAIAASTKELEEEGKRVEDGKAPQDKFDRKVKAHNARIKALNDGIGQLSADVDAMNKAVVAHNEKCGGITFLPEDKAAILKEREAAKK